MAIQERALASQLGQFRLPRVPPTLKDPAIKRYLEDLLRALDLQVTALTGVQDNGTLVPIRSTIDFIGASITDDLQNDRTQVTYGGGGGAAPVNATYIVVSLNGSLTAERVLVAGDGLTSTDGGANGNFTLDVGSGTGISVGASSVNLTNTGVAAATYGSATAIPILTVDLQGRITTATTTPFSAGGGFKDIFLLMGG